MSGSRLHGCLFHIQHGYQPHREAQHNADRRAAGQSGCHGRDRHLPSPTISFEEPTEALPEITLPTAVSDEAAEPTTEDTTYSDDALQTMLSADLSLSYPVAGGKVVRPYSKDSVYFKTLNVWKPHLGTDFAADLGDKILAMCGGEVTKVTDDKLFGKTVEISVNNAVCVYSGLGDIKVSQGDRVEKGDVIGSVGTVPFEADSENHIHAAVKVNGSYADPLNFIGNEE
jgi:murein DD-endopeptidase MepM/ murein hydrolase activator NlpD